MSPGSTWTGVPGATNLPGPTSAPYILKGTNFGGANGASRFYRVKLEKQ